MFLKLENSKKGHGDEVMSVVSWTQLTLNLISLAST
jgi:hypothetical protein